VLAYDYWMDRFGGDRGIVEKQITLDKKSVTVIGVLQPAPFFPRRVELLANMVNSQHHLSAQMVEGRVHRMTEVVARLKSGATLTQARTEVESVYSRLQREYKSAYDPAQHFRVAVLPFKQALGERARLTVWLLMAAAAFVLVIAVANVANLTLMRGVRREHELVVRAALGAGVGRLRRLLLVENLLLTVFGAALGVGIALGGVRLLVSFAARYSSRADEIHVDATVLGFMLALSLGVALLLSFVSSLPREGRFASWILTGGHRATGGPRKHRLQHGLVIVQIAVSVVLLAGAGLLTRTMIQLAEIDTGLRTEQVLTMQVNLLTPNELLSNPGAGAAARVRYEEMRRQIAALPGVVDVGLGYPLPLRGTPGGFDIKAEGKSLAVGEAQPQASMRTADPHFFHAAGIPLVAGRAFDVTDGPQAARVVVVNRTLANRLFPGENPIGKRIAWTGELLKYAPIGGDWRTIVGIVADTRDSDLEATPEMVVYQPSAQSFLIGGGFAVRADSNVAKIAPAAMRIVRRLAPTAPLEHVMTYAQIKDESVAPRRLNATLVSSFGVLAVVIAAVGIAGVLAFSVSARTNEIGIRMSLGADSGRVQRMILGEGGVLLVAGLALGMAGAFGIAGVMRGLLFGVAPHDPVTFIGVALTMATIGLVACWLPALRAARIDPAITMRSS
jgi:predicted permease